MATTRAEGRGCLLRALRAYVLFVLACAALAVSFGYLAAARAVRHADGNEQSGVVGFAKLHQVGCQIGR